MSTLRDRYVFFATGAAVGSAIGLVIGALVSFWLGEETVEGIKRIVKRLLGRDQHPNFELFLQ